MLLTELSTESVFKNFLEELRRLEEVRKQTVAEIVKSGCLEGLIHRVPPFAPESIRVAGIDGGLASLTFGFLDIVLVRAVGAFFEYQKGELTKARYFPSELPELLTLAISEPVDSASLVIVSGMYRQIAEVETAIQVAESEGPDLLLLDGSVVPQYCSADDMLKELYLKLVGRYQRLYEICRDRGIFLAGFVKNSRGRQFLQLVSDSTSRGKREALARFRDVDFLRYTMGPKQRTRSVLYRGALGGDLKPWREKVHLFYLRSSEATLPFRVEFLESGGDPELTAGCLGSWVSFLSSFNPEMGAPSALLEADLRARIGEKETEIVRTRLKGLSRIEGWSGVSKLGIG